MELRPLSHGPTCMHAITLGFCAPFLTLSSSVLIFQIYHNKEDLSSPSPLLGRETRDGHQCFEANCKLFLSGWEWTSSEKVRISFFPLLSHCHVSYYDNFAQIKELLLIFVSMCYTPCYGIQSPVKSKQDGQSSHGPRQLNAFGGKKWGVCFSIVVFCVWGVIAK